MRIAVTGASGFVGGAVWRAAEARGWTVYPFGRRPGVRTWDIDDAPLTQPPEVDAVVHAAAAVTDWGSGAAVWKTNVDGTRNVLDSFPGKRFVHVSSASVYDPNVATVRAREDEAPVSKYLTAYGASKAAAEGLLADRPDTVVLRPHAVYGPGDPTLLPRVLGAIRGQTLVIVGDGSALHSLTSIGNLADAALLACVPQAPTGTYNVGDAEPVALEDALAALLAERGLNIRIRHLPVRVGWAVAGILESTWRLLDRPRPPRLTRYTVSHLGLERTLDLSAARFHLGFTPLPTTFAGAAAW